MCRVRRGGVLSLLLLGALALESGAQARLDFFACGDVRFFGPACPPVLPEVLPPVEEAPAPEEPPPLEPLFTPETVAPTTPPVVLRLLQEPTEANAQAFLAWQQARLQRILEVQALLKRLHATAPAPEVP
ncbi:MAG: hypothetical protein L0Y66_23540 [Myxococcaceae bacterium]|nr:hypothetical protein [Myxococcaceae bacterium]